MAALCLCNQMQTFKEVWESLKVYTFVNSYKLQVYMVQVYIKFQILPNFPLVFASSFANKDNIWHLHSLSTDVYF